MDKNFKKYDIFYNSNKYLSLVYAIEGNTAKIINYNGTVYTLDISKKTYEKFNFNVVKISVKDFILQFPEVYLNDTNVDSIIYNLKKEFLLMAAEVYNDVNNLPKDLGDIEFLREHPQILQKLIERGKDKSLKPFIEYVGCGIGRGGFSWMDSQEKKAFWVEVLTHKRPEHFYTKYPKVSIPDLVEIKQKFPVGCTFNNNNLNKHGLLTDAKNVKVTENAVFSREGDNWYITTKEQGNWTVYYNGHYADIITMESKIDPPYLLDVQNMFPIGTVFNNANIGADRTKNEELFIKDNNFVFDSDYWFYKSPNGLRYVVWKEGQYATILGKLKEEKSLSLNKEQEKDVLLTQAKMKFKKGVKFAINNLYPDNDTLYEIAQEPIFIRHSDGDILVKCVEERNHIPRQVVVYCGRKKEWATIIGYLYDMETSGIDMNLFISEANAQKIITVQNAMQSTGKSIFPLQALQDRLDVLKLEYPLTPQESYKKSEFTIEPMKEIPIKEVSLDHIKFTIEKLK